PILAIKAGSDAAEQYVLFHGPSCTGKTFSAKIMANELGAEYAEVDFPKIASPYVGQASKNIDNVFKSIREQAQKQPDKKFLVAFNEIDSMLIPLERSGNNQSYVLENRTAFLNGLDSVADLKNVKIVGTTNANPSSGNLDLAALSRFGNIFEVELPTVNEIKASLKWHLKNCESVEKDKFFDKNKSEIDKLAKILHDRNFSQRDVEKIAKIAKTNYGITLGKSSNPEKEVFQIKYLEDALNDKEFTTGAVGRNGNTAASQNDTKLTFWQRVGLFLLRK
ncbi:ATP-binding protein, partial [bacterium]|nr:ATP-binding protein [bacterium]